jgi:hypothetical protein
MHQLDIRRPADVDGKRGMHSPTPPLSAVFGLQVEPQCTAHITPGGNVRIELRREAVSGSAATAERDPVQLAIFSHRWADHTAAACSS